MATTHSDADTNIRPLSGVRIVDLGDGPASLIGRILTDLGADVILVEPASGSKARLDGKLADGQSIGFAINALGKRSLAADISQADGRSAVLNLLAEADILIAGADMRDAFDLNELSAQFPRLVIMSVSPFGLGNSLSDWKGSDAIFQAVGALLSRSGLPGRPPLPVPGRIAEQSAMVQAVYALLLAYLNRLKTDRGDLLDFANVLGSAQALDPGFGIQGSATSGVPPHKLARGRPDESFRYPILPCKDGHVRLCLLAKKQWLNMFEWMGRPEEFADPVFHTMAGRYKSKEFLPAIKRFLADKTLAELESQALAGGVPLVGMASLESATTNAQSTARKAFKKAKLSNHCNVTVADGVIEIDGKRANISSALPQPEKAVSWRERNATDTAAAPSWANTDSDRPLAGLRVLDLGVIVVGAEQGRLLADQGADVVKIENPSFPDGSRQTRDKSFMSPGFAAGHKNKRSLSLDLRSDKGRALLLKLVAEADVIFSNFKPGTLDSLGLSEEILRAANPGIVMSDSSAFGASGPWAGRMGYGPLVRAGAGLTQLWRYDDDPESWADATTVYPDHVAARMGVIGALSLLIRRTRTGKGGRASISQAEVMMMHLASDIAEIDLRNQGELITETKPDFGPFVSPSAGDDEWCVVDPQTDTEYAALITMLNDPQDAKVELANWTGKRTPMEAANELQKHGIPAAPMLRIYDMPEFEYYHERDFFRPLEHPELDTAYKTENAPVKSREIPDPPQIPAPIMGQHSRNVVAEWLGLDDAAIAELENEEIIGGCIAL